MPMIELVFAVCLNAEINNCRVERLAFLEDVTPAACTMRAMPYLAQWAGDHPQYKIMGWKCTYPNEHEQDA